jgi:hypothetical protein
MHNATSHSLCRFLLICAAFTRATDCTSHLRPRHGHASGLVGHAQHQRHQHRPGQPTGSILTMNTSCDSSAVQDTSKCPSQRQVKPPLCHGGYRPATSCLAVHRNCAYDHQIGHVKGALYLLRASVQANPHMPCRAHAVPLQFSDSTVSFVEVNVVAGNIRTASPTL